MNDKIIEKTAAILEREREMNEIFSQVYTCRELLEKDFPDIDFIIPGLIPCGLTIIAGSPKIGKTWLGLQMAVSLSCGGYILGNINVPKKTILYLALEDTQRRLSNRLKKLKAEPNENLFFATKWKTNQKAIELIKEFKNKHPELDVVIIDTLQSVRGLSEQNYTNDYYDLTLIRALCDDLNISIILIHHTRKSEAVDFVDEIAGTHGISGVVDTILVLKKERRKREATLFVTSRDIEEQEIVLEFNGEIGSWSIIGDADIVRLSQERKEIIEAMEDGECRPDVVAKRLGKKSDTIRKTMNRMEQDGELIKVQYGVYKVAAKIAS